jgi:hypothetical protein
MSVSKTSVDNDQEASRATHLSLSLLQAIVEARFDTEERDGIQLSRQQPDRKKRHDFQPVLQPALLTRRRIHIPADFAANASFKGFDEGWVSVSIHEIGALWEII